MKQIVVLILSILISACSNLTSPDPENAQTSLLEFITYLNEGSYEKASDLYGGDYEDLLSMNPEIPPKEVVSLWQNACEINGFQCLQARSVSLEEQISITEWKFLVEFTDINGSLFTLGPCCGADADEMPPQTQFEFIVRKTGGGEFLVMTMPIFMP